MDREAARKLWNSTVVGQSFPDYAPASCGACGKAFATGTAMMIFGLADSMIAKRECTCLTCGLIWIAGEQAPSGAMMYVEAEHRSLSFDQLPQEYVENVLIGFDMLDRLTRLSSATEIEAMKEKIT